VVGWLRRVVSLYSDLGVPTYSLDRGKPIAAAGGLYPSGLYGIYLLGVSFAHAARISQSMSA